MISFCRRFQYADYFASYVTALLHARSSPRHLLAVPAGGQYARVFDDIHEPSPGFADITRRAADL